MIIIPGGVTYGISNISQDSKVDQDTQNVVDNFSSSRAHNIAGSMSDILMMQISNDMEYRSNSDVTEDLFDGKVSYIAEDTFFDGDSLIKITVIAKLKDVKNIAIRYTKKQGEIKE